MKGGSSMLTDKERKVTWPDPPPRYKNNEREMENQFLFAEKLFCVALLRCGVDIAHKVLTEYLKIREDEDILEWCKTPPTEEE